MSNWRPDTALLGRYAVSGVANTAVGVLAIYTLMWLHFSPYLANLLGYTAGLLFSYFNARNYVFRFSGSHGGGSLRYAVAFGACYALNVAVLAVGLETLRWQAWIAQGAGIGVHTTLMFLLSRYFVFAERAQSTGPAQR